MSDPAPPPGAKRPHDLHLARSAEDLLDRLVQRGIDPLAIAHSRIQPGTQCAILAGGSLTEGTGSPVSDLDLLILHDQASHYLEQPGGLQVRRGCGVSVNDITEGVEIDLEYYAWDALRPLKLSLLQAASVVRQGCGALPFLEKAEERFLHRLQHGWILAGPEMVDTWRRSLRSDRLGQLVALKNLVICADIIEDAWAALGSGTREAAYAGRNCVEYLMLALAGLTDRTSPTRRFLFRYPTAHLSLDLAATWHEGLDLLAADLAATKDAQKVYLVAVTRFFIQVRDHIAADSALAPFADQVLGALPQRPPSGDIDQA
ncbi:MAG: hypothetical protein IOD03_15905 [Methylocystis sp.]|uniref:hypothetical protein n=1 Tax=Phenylobacterium sp. TaxID=1871053 RepID=UPI0025E9872E|nr:hypothetical protein [Phenylobacterium sp.]MCA3585162.1 hypothetical protein [Methylocystis sp.]MCA6286265.1 hypothetical protein [Phenylobacterium sp.]MCA6289321.1 hypothetical protein [Phenylobacterium sp.]MCA6346647.1 hypothetical protein [Phenylobacterium sp.]MCA6349243.1 hypothetical protein [Phenylobacterium sp.]